MGNLFSGIGFTILAPMILARTDSNSLIFGSVQTVGAIGGIVGGMVMSAWGGFKRRVHWRIVRLDFAAGLPWQSLVSWVVCRFGSQA